MSKILYYATTNQDKYNKAAKFLAKYDVIVEQVALELDELQTFDQIELVTKKAKAAFEILQKPVLVSDDCWSIPALRGFPNVNMKQCNHYLIAEDWLRLMQGIEDRRIDMIANLAFCKCNINDKNDSEVKVWSYTDPSVFLNEKKGHHEKSHILEVIARIGETRSVAEALAVGDIREVAKPEIWKELSELI